MSIANKEDEEEEGKTRILSKNPWGKKEKKRKKMKYVNFVAVCPSPCKALGRGSLCLRRAADTGGLTHSEGGRGGIVGVEGGGRERGSERVEKGGWGGGKWGGGSCERLRLGGTDRGSESVRKGDGVTRRRVDVFSGSEGGG